MHPALVGVGAVAAAGAGMLAYAHLETTLFTLREVTVPVLPRGHADEIGRAHV